MINRLSLPTRQCELPGLARSTYYYVPEPVSEQELELLKLIDQCYLELPFYGTRRIKDRLFDNHELIINRKRIQTYILRAKGFVYLLAIMDWYSRRVLSWRVSTTMDTSFCIEALEDAIEQYGCPEIFNTDQGSQFTSDDFTQVLKDNEIKISMDGKGRWVDNVFVEHLWRSVKYEEVYLNAYDTVADAKESLRKYFEFYNTERRHQSLGKQTPDSIYTQSADRMAA